MVSGCGGQPGMIEIDGQDGGRAVVDLRVTDKRPAGNRAGTHRNHDLGLGHRVVGFAQRQLHGLAHRAGD